ncbi:hypothetical protein DPMN_083063 [Dreissena polymorpha]|uniref:Uncharacterized protein n=1 Tax=Dreissena polymorpha TaxID=45954 RepID=A0A9D3YB68_DREPO|nr:hypothetical protein DPMN_083063 [Dreissena polymorpha]
MSMSCAVGILQGDNITTVTLFTPQIRPLLQDDLHIDLNNNSSIQEKLLEALPIAVGFTRRSR